MQEVHFLLFFWVCLQHVIGPFFQYPKDLIIWNIQTHFIPNESYNKKGVFIIIIIIIIIFCGVLLFSKGFWLLEIFKPISF
jgi:hypothetical protein